MGEVKPKDFLRSKDAKPLDVKYLDSLGISVILPANSTTLMVSIINSRYNYFIESISLGGEILTIREFVVKSEGRSDNLIFKVH